MRQFTTLYDVGDYVKLRHGPRRNFHMRIGGIKATLGESGLWLVQYRPVFSTGTPGSWTEEKNLELVRRAFPPPVVPTVREFMEGKKR